MNATAQTIEQDRDVIAEMLTENTGAHMLDSGGAYGRNWERNQGRDFTDEPYAVVRFDTWHHNGALEWSIDYTINLYHWLHERLEYDPELQARFDAFEKTRPNREAYLSIMEAFADSIDGAGGLYGDSSGPFTHNSYNGESLLSQVIQWTGWETDEGTFILLQIHGGCDVRGGYTAPRAFHLDGGMTCDGLADMLMDTDGHLIAYPDDYNVHVFPGFEEPRAVRWFAYDACRWECEESGPNLDEYPATNDPSLRGKGYVYIDEEGNGYCPLTGGKLEA